MQAIGRRLKRQELATCTATHFPGLCLNLQAACWNKTQHNLRYELGGRTDGQRSALEFCLQIDRSVIMRNRPCVFSFHQVMRIMRAVREALATVERTRLLPTLGQGPAPPAEPDAYELLGLEPSCTALDVKKRYMRMSLLVHPGACRFCCASRCMHAVHEDVAAGAFIPATPVKTYRWLAFP